jgi:hypothetical protein
MKIICVEEHSVDPGLAEAGPDLFVSSQPQWRPNHCL